MFKKKSYVNFYCTYPGVASTYPVKKAIYHKHEWLRKLSKKYLEDLEEQKKSKCPFSQIISTAKCPGIKDIISRGYILYAPCDIKIVTENNGESISWSSMESFDKEFITYHTPESLLTHIDYRPNTCKFILKLNLPWMVECSKDLVLMQTHVHYGGESRFTTATGTLDPREAPNCNIQLFWHVMDGVEIIKAGTPLVQYIPMPKYIDPEFEMSEDFEKEKNNKVLKYLANHTLTRNHKLLKDYLNDTSD